MEPSGAPVYRISFDDDLFDSLSEIKDFLPNVKDVESLKRTHFMVQYIPSSAKVSSFGTSLSLYLESLKVCGQRNIFRSLLGFLFTIHKFATCIDPEHKFVDDIYRKYLKKLSAWSFVRTFTEGPGYMLLCHLDCLGGPSPYTKEQIVEDIDSWTGPKNNALNDNRDFIMERLDYYFSAWGCDLTNRLSFEEYCNDPIRWGTSGGGPKNKTFDTRNKWAWGFEQFFNPKVSSIYAEAEKAKSECGVSLKREPKKTREIISTPIASYLRQCYLLYCRGPTRLESPISRSTWMETFMETRYAWYGCIDAERFDHSVPKWFVQEVVRRLAFDDETRRIAQIESDSLEKLIIEHEGRRWRYNGGLLSGWRITSLVGTLLSTIAADYIRMRTNTVGSIREGALGDDLVLGSYYHSIKKEDLNDVYNQFGLTSNLQKATSGKEGEFLRRVISDKGILSYPALGLRPCTFANPWIENLFPTVEQEISNNWLTFLSRMLPHRTNDMVSEWTKNRILDQIKTENTPITWQAWRDWLATPISAGGGGCVEWSDARVWTVIEYERPEKPQLGFLSVFGLDVGNRKKYAPKRANYSRPIDDWSIRKMASELRSETALPTLRMPRDVNLTETLWKWYSDDEVATYEIGKMLNIYVPRGLRKVKKDKLFRFIMGMDSESAGITSIQTPKDATASSLHLYKRICASLAIKKKWAVATDVPAAATLFVTHHLRERRFVYGTW